MPFFAKEDFQLWGDDGTSSVWARGFLQIAESHEHSEFCRMLAQLNAITAADILTTAMNGLDQRQLLEQLIEKSKQLPESGASAMAGELREVERLERTLRQREEELATSQSQLSEFQRKLRLKEEVLQNAEAELQQREQREDELMAAAAEEAVAQVAPKLRAQAANEDAVAMAAEEAAVQAPKPFGQAARPPQMQPSQPAGLAAPGALQPTSQSHASEVEPGGDELEPDPEGSPFAEALLGASFKESRVRSFWQMAKAAYNKKSEEHVEEEGKIWQVIAEIRHTNTRVIARQIKGCAAVEIAFRGTVGQDASGVESSANWASNFDGALTDLDPDTYNEMATNTKPQVRKGFQDAYRLVKPKILEWLQARDGHVRVRVAGHSLGGALATLAAVHLKSFVHVEAVVTFGCPRVGAKNFVELYKALDLHRRTARFANQADPVWRVPLEKWGFVHVVEGYSLGSCGRLGLSLKSHSMEGSDKSYFHTLHDAIEGQVLQSKVADTLSAVAGRLMSSAASTDDVMRTQQELKQELKVSLAVLAQGMRSAERRLHDAITKTQHWTWLTFAASVTATVEKHLDDLPPWSQAGSGSAWFLGLTERRDYMLRAAQEELQDRGSQLGRFFVDVYLRMGDLVIRAMEASGAARGAVDKEVKEFNDSLMQILESRRLDLASCVAVMRSLPCPSDSKLRDFIRLALHDVPDADWSSVAAAVLQDPTCLKLEFEKDTADEKWFTHLLQSTLFRCPSWTSLCLRFSSLKEVVGSLPVSLQPLKLNFSHNQNFTDASFEKLAENLPASLQALRLDFGFNEDFTDAGLKKLAENLPASLQALPSLQALHLDFGFNKKFTDASFEKLAENLPASLQSLHLDFGFNKNFTDAGLEKLAENLPASLQSLQLNFSSNENFTDAGFEKLADNLPASLQALHLKFSSSKNFTDASFEKLADNLPASLQSLHLDFSSNENFTDAGFEKLADNLPASLQALPREARGQPASESSISAFGFWLQQELRGCRLREARGQPASESSISAFEFFLEQEIHGRKL
ncbi:unnamed protein product [Effrenium voratum]|uniref:Fungal lipase-type domain-containing protein n=1 Tax=Effrenium voratum TaxID=2562239 RepID=A0AA36NG46_9DINO|nr:unnamed protein product [Effrenium voratum]